MGHPDTQQLCPQYGIANNNRAVTIHGEGYVINCVCLSFYNNNNPYLQNHLIVIACIVFIANLEKYGPCRTEKCGGSQYGSSAI